MGKKILIAVLILGAVGIAIYLLSRPQQHPRDIAPDQLYSVLAIRSFRNKELVAQHDTTAQYTVSVGEEFKLTWFVENMIEPGQLVFRGPEGIDTGIVTIPVSQPSASTSEALFRAFTATKPGDAVFTLIASGRGPQTIITQQTEIDVRIR